MKNLDTVYQYIRNQIETKQIFPGHKIIEEKLAADLNLSRSSVRNALVKLQYEGFVDLIPNRGAFVIKPSLSEVQNLYHVRLHLELGAYKAAIENVTTKNLDKLEQLLDSQKNLMDNFFITDYAVLNRQFHEEIVLASANPFYEKLLNEIYNRIYILLIFYDDSRNNAGSFVTHTKMFQALRDGDIEEGIKAVIADNTLAIDDLALLWKSNDS